MSSTPAWMCFNAPQDAGDAACDVAGRAGWSSACAAEARQIRPSAKARANGASVNFMVISLKIGAWRRAGDLQRRDDGFDVSARRFRVRADLVGAIDQRLSECRFDTRQAHIEACLEE